MWDWISRLEILRNQGIPFVMATVSQVTGSTPREIGAKMLVLEGEEFYGTIGGGHLEQLVLQDARKALLSNQCQTIRYPLGAKTGQCCGGVVEILLEPVHCGPQLFVFGVGHVGQAVCRSLLGTPFTVHAIDDRTEWIQSEGLPKEVIRHEVEWDDFIADFLSSNSIGTTKCAWHSEKTYVVVMTHRHDRDQEIIHSVIHRPAKYIGLIGSSSKWLRFKQRLSMKGITEAQLNRVRCPIGLPIGGKAPQEVAISLAAELIQLHYSSISNPSPES